MKLDKRSAIKLLAALAKCGDTERAHSEADLILLALIGDAAITTAYAAVPKWYA